MNISAQDLLRLYELRLSKVQLCGILMIFAEICEVQNTSGLNLKTAQNASSVEPQNTSENLKAEANCAVLRQNEVYLSSSKSRELSKKEGKEETSLIGKPSTRKPRENKDFDDFWRAYPKRVSKQAAILKFDHAVRSGVPSTRIIEAAKHYANTTSTTEKQFIKAPDVWLNKGCYDDELPLANGLDAAPDLRTPEQKRAEWARTLETFNG